MPAGAADGAGAGCDAGRAAGAATAVAAIGEAAGATGAGAAIAGTPWGGVLDVNGLAWDEPRGSSAPQPKQNL